MKMQVNDRIVFIGDSITESGRFDDPENIGNGYVRLIRDYFLTAHPDCFPEIVNRGIGGNKITDLTCRWDRDVNELNPDFVSISIGINDIWRQIDHPEKEQVYPDQFEKIYQSLLSQVKAKTNAELILMEPTIIGEDINSEGNQKLIPYVEIVQRLAESFDAILVPLHQAFTHYLKANTEYKLTTDGVHMNSVGNMLIYQTWLKAFKNVYQKTTSIKGGFASR